MQCVEDDNFVIAIHGPSRSRRSGIPRRTPDRDLSAIERVDVSVGFRSLLAAHHADARRGFAKQSQ
jgi:hypothetical protein